MIGWQELLQIRHYITRDEHSKYIEIEADFQDLLQPRKIIVLQKLKHGLLPDKALLRGQNKSLTLTLKCRNTHI